MELLDGKKVSNDIKDEIANAVSDMKARGEKVPHLAAVIVGNDGASLTYVGSKVRSCERVGFESTLLRLPSTTSEVELLKEIKKLNENPEIDGFIVQLPLPEQIDTQSVLMAIDPDKDVDGFHPINVGNLSSGNDALVPCTPYGCYLLLKEVISDFNGLNAVVIGRSNINGKPMTQLLLKENCTVTITHSKTKNLKNICQGADILVASVGIAKLVKQDWVKSDCVVIDVGINRIEENGSKKLVGDVDFENVKDKVKAITPVPGGVGPMTISCLLQNTLKAYQKINS